MGVESSMYRDEARVHGASFIDVFAGCGGLSLGLMSAGWKGLFAVEKDRFAFESLKANLIEGPMQANFNWPNWLPKAPISLLEFMGTHRRRLESLVGSVEMIAGGPPCQGFSSAGRRQAADPRNALVRGYLEMVRLIQPRLVLMENVNGIAVDFAHPRQMSRRLNYADAIVESLSADYDVHWEMVNVSDFGVPQARTRFILMAQRKGHGCAANPFDLLRARRKSFLSEKGLIAPVGAASAISDLEVSRNGVVPCGDALGFDSVGYEGPRTSYQRLLHSDFGSAPNSLRLARHRPNIVDRFGKIIDACRSQGRLNVSLGREMREAFGIKKMALRVLDPDRPAPTITSMPDDLLHYSEPRTLTVRENARLQSFPDWFEFRGKYTTGGDLRRKEVPRFTQVANAVPPLFAEVLGRVLADWSASVRLISKRRINQDCDVFEVLPVLDETAA